MKRVKLFLAVLLTAALLCGCGGPQTAPVDPDPPAPVEPAEPELPAAIDFTWKPYVSNVYITETAGASLEQQLRAAVDAMLNRAEYSPCPIDDMETDKLVGTLRQSFPPFAQILADYRIQDGQIFYTYALSAEEQTRLMDDFARQVEAIIEEAVCETDTALMAVLSLYHHYSKAITYDYAGLDSDPGEVDLTAYRGIMEKEGICQTFAPAFAYLCMQLGVDAITVGGLNSTNDEAHSWVMLRLDGKDYFADPTFENGDGGQGLRYFGMTGEKRALDGYEQKDVNVGWNLKFAGDMSLDDTRFMPLWPVQTIVEITRTPEGDMVLDAISSDGDLLTVTITQAGAITVELTEE